MKHNKRRNTLLVFELFARKIAGTIFDATSSSMVTESKVLLKKSFAPTTQLYKELCLARILKETHCKTEEEVSSLVERVKQENKGINGVWLESEKTALIEGMNKLFPAGKTDEFFSQHLSDYQDYASIQLLLGSWRSSSPNLFESVREQSVLEQKIRSILRTPKLTKEQIEESLKKDVASIDENAVAQAESNIREMLGEYTPEQAKLVEAFVMGGESNEAFVKKSCDETCDKVQKSLEEYAASHPQDSLNGKKIQEMRGAVASFKSKAKVDSQGLGFVLSLADIEKELRGNQ